MTKATETEAEETETDPEETETGETETDSGQGVTLSGLADKVDALASRVAGMGRGGRAGSRADTGEEVASQVRSEVAKIKAADDRKRTATDRVEQLAAQVKAIAEKPPREFRPITKWMWGEDETV